MLFHVNNHNLTKFTQFTKLTNGNKYFQISLLQKSL